MSELIASSYSQYVIAGLGVLGLVWGGINTLQVNNVQLEVSNIKVAPQEEKSAEEEDDVLLQMPKT
jgi:hypothetical protein